MLNQLELASTKFLLSSKSKLVLTQCTLRKDSGLIDSSDLYINVIEILEL